MNFTVVERRESYFITNKCILTGSDGKKMRIVRWLLEILDLNVSFFLLKRYELNGRILFYKQTI